MLSINEPDVPVIGSSPLLPGGASVGITVLLCESRNHVSPYTNTLDMTVKLYLEKGKQIQIVIRMLG